MLALLGYDSGRIGIELFGEIFPGIKTADQVVWHYWYC